MKSDEQNEETSRYEEQRMMSENEE